MDRLTKSQQKVYDFLRQKTATGVPPTVREICAEAFRRFGLARIYAEPFARNTGSRRVLEKAGFVLEGVMRRGVYKRGEVLDYCMYALVPDDAPGGGSGL